MKVIAFLLSIVLPLMAAGCIGGDGPRMEEIQLTEAQQRFKAKTTFKNGVVSVEVKRQDGSTRTLDSAMDFEETWGLLLPRPVIPGFSSREWLMAENHYDGRTLLYALVNWDDENPADYLAAGWWLHFPPGVSFRDLEEAERGVFIDGPEIDLSNPPQMPADGVATYLGSAGGLYQYQYGSAWGELQGDSQYIEFGADMVLTANFTDNTIEGCIGCAGDIEIRRGGYLFPIITWRSPRPDALPTDYEVRLGATRFNPDGTFENTDITVMHPERTVTETTGLWVGQFSNVPDPDGNPRQVVGCSDVGFDEADGSSGSFISIFSGLTPATLGPVESETP